MGRSFVIVTAGVMALALAAFSLWRFWIDGVGLEGGELVAPLLWQWARLVEFAAWLFTWPAILIFPAAVFAGGAVEAAAARR